jgi:glyoxylate reductase
MSRIFVTRKIPFWDQISKPLVDAGHEIVVYAKNSRVTPEELKTELKKGYDGLLCLLTEKINANILEADEKKQLKVIANYAVGFDNINVEDCKARNIQVTNTPSDAVNESVAEFSLALLMTLTRRLGEAGEFMRNAAYEGWEPEVFLGQDLKGMTLGVIGTGRIGSLVMERAKGLGMTTIGFSRTSGLKLEEVLSQSDFVSLHVPLNSETTHLINGKTLSVFKKGAILINTARGPVVNEEEVAQALRAGMLGGYGADVFENEPHPYPELLQMENVILTPHIASATEAARLDMGTIAVANLLAGLSGQTPPNVVE